MSLRYHLFYYALSCLLLVLTLLVHYVFLILLAGYLLFVFWRLGVKHTIFIIVITVIFGTFMRYPKAIDDVIIHGEIVSVDEKSVVLKTNNTKVKIYGELQDFEIGDELEVQVNYFAIKQPTNENAFNYRNYLYSQGITNTASLVKIIDSQKKNTYFKKLLTKMDSDDLEDSYTKMFVLGIKDETVSDYYKQLTNLSIVHLFALSGLHIHLLQDLLKKIFIFVMPERLISYVSLVIIGLYIYIIPFNISFMRAYLVMVLQTVFKNYLNRLDCLSIVAMFFIFMNPYIIFNLSFIFSYFMYLVILLINQQKYLNIFVYLSSIPIILAIQYRLNILSLFLGIVLTPLIGVLYKSIWLYVIFGELFKPIISLIIMGLNNIVVFSTDFSKFLNFSKPSLFVILSYYFIYFKMIFKINVKQKIKREVLMLISLVMMFYLKPLYQLYGQVVMIDVGQGDCFLIQQPFNRGNILIDTGGLKNQDLATQTLVPYLHSIGIFKLDCVFISHDDFDHSGAYESLSKQIEVKKTIRNYQDKIEIGDVSIEMLQTDKSNDINDNSLVFVATVNDIKYLFTGDISSEVEEQIIEKYNNLHVDVLKVSHHGSNSATSAAFLNFLKPKIALISCGKNNFYGHPHSDVIRRLNDYGIKIYRSDEMGMVRIVYYGNDNYIFHDFSD